MVVFDECGIPTSLTPTYGWGPQGQRAFGSVPCNWGKTVALIAALTTSCGLAAWTCMMLEGATDHLAFEAYIEKVLAPNLITGSIYICLGVVAALSDTGKGGKEAADLIPYNS